MIRIFLDHPLDKALTVEIEKPQSHYLLNVMRLKDGDPVHVFNGKNGEWEAQVKQLSKKSCSLEIVRHLKDQPTDPEKHFLFPPIRQNRLDFMIEKATELGVTHFYPILTDHTSIPKINIDRLKKIAIEAAEQSERLTVPEFEALTPLREALKTWPKTIPIFMGAERKDVPNCSNLPSPCGVLIGPEGGFSEQEFGFLGKYDFVTPLSLGDSILRTETAAIVLLSKTLAS